MYVLDYLIYHLRPFGIVAHSPAVPERMSVEAAIAAAVQSSTVTAKNGTSGQIASAKAAATANAVNTVVASKPNTRQLPLEAKEPKIVQP